MKRIIATAVLAAMAAGCSLVTIETDEWRVTVRDHWLKREMNQVEVDRRADGSYKAYLNGYKHDASEQLPAFTKEMWAGIGILGRIAAATINPTAAAVPLTTEAADADAVAKIQRELAAATAELAKVKAEAKAASASGCEGGACSPQ